MFILFREFSQPFVTRVENALVQFLLFKGTIPVNSLLIPSMPLDLGLLGLLWLGETVVHHVLVVRDKAHFFPHA